MLQAFVVVLSILGWNQTDCINGSVLLFEDLSYTVYEASNTVTCIEYYTAPNAESPSEVYLVQISRANLNTFYISEVYYDAANCLSFPDCVVLEESIIVFRVKLNNPTNGIAN